MSDDEDYNYDEEDFELAESDGNIGRISVGDLSSLTRKSTSSIGMKSKTDGSTENKIRKSVELKSAIAETPKVDQEDEEDLLSDGMDLEKYIMEMKINVPQPDVAKSLEVVSPVKATSSSRLDLEVDGSTTPQRSKTSTPQPKKTMFSPRNTTTSGSTTSLKSPAHSFSNLKTLIQQQDRVSSAKSTARSSKDVPINNANGQSLVSPRRSFANSSSTNAINSSTNVTQSTTSSVEKSQTTINKPIPTKKTVEESDHDNDENDEDEDEDDEEDDEDYKRAFHEADLSAAAAAAFTAATTSVSVTSLHKAEKQPPFNNHEKAKKEEESIPFEEKATKVDALLMELFPDRYGAGNSILNSILPGNNNNNPNPKKGKTKKTTSAKSSNPIIPPLPANPPVSSIAASLANDPLYALVSDHPSHKSTSSSSNQSHGLDKIGVGGGDVLASLDGQLKLLRKELKMKDDKIQRLTEHSVNMANHMDKLKAEITRLTTRLHDTEVELQEKDAKLVEALKSKKKAMKKMQQQSSPEKANGDKSYGALEAENGRLREREQALMEAVEELSSQNEDLIIKLRESMQRELELSSKRAQLVSHSILPRSDASLPNIHEKDSPANQEPQYMRPVRSQSEPSNYDNIPQKRLAKNKKKSHYI